MGEDPGLHPAGRPDHRAGRARQDLGPSQLQTANQFDSAAVIKQAADYQP
ncbi:hypothetical protein ACFQV8_13645 [Pseudonocardia benzenivorans]